MKIQLTSCDAARPDKRAIAKMLEEIAVGVSDFEAVEMTEFLLDGSTVDIEISGKNTSSAFRALRKLEIDYEMNE